MEQEPAAGWAECLAAAANNRSSPETVGETLHALDLDWTIPILDGATKAQFEKAIQKRARRDIIDIEDEEGSESADRYRSVYSADFAAGKYFFDGEHCRKARQTQYGQKVYLYLMLRRCHPKITEEQAEAIWNADPVECVRLYGWSLGNFPASPNGEASGTAGTKSKQTATLDSP